MPFEVVNKHTHWFVLRYNEAWYLVRWLQDRRGRPKLGFWNTKFLGKYSVNLNFSNNYSLLSWSHLAMYQASLYLKTNLRVCLFTTPKGIKIGPSYPELRGGSKLPRTLKHPVWSSCGRSTTRSEMPLRRTADTASRSFVSSELNK